MAGKSNFWANGVLALLFNGTTLAGIAQNASSGALTQLWVSLHTADPSASGSQASNEVSYTSYARVAVNRDGTGWSVSGDSVDPVNPITWAASTGGAASTATFFGIGTASAGGGNLLYSGAVTPNISISAGVQPQLTTASSISEA